MADPDPSERPLEVLSAVFNLAVLYPRFPERQIEYFLMLIPVFHSLYKQENSLEMLPRMIPKTWPSPNGLSAKRSNQPTRNSTMLWTRSKSR